MLLAPVVYFADPVQTSLWAVWAEQYAQEEKKYTTSWKKLKAEISIASRLRQTQPSDFFISFKSPAELSVCWSGFEKIEI